MDPRKPTLKVAWLQEPNLWGIAKATAVVLALIGLARMASGLFDVWLTVAGGLMLAVILHPWIEWLESRRVPRGVALVGTFLALLLGVGLGLYLVVPLVLGQLQAFVANLPNYAHRFSQLATWLTSKKAPLGAFITRPRLNELVGGVLLTSARHTIDLTTGLLYLGASLFVIVFFGLFLLYDRESIRESVVSLLPERLERRAPRFLDALATDVGGYLLGVLVVGSIIAVVTSIGLSLLGVPYAVLIGVIAGCMEALPYIGPIISATLATLAGLSASLWLGLWAFLFFLVVQQLEGNFLAPFVLGRYTRMAPFWISLALVIGIAWAGIPGGLFAMPTAIAVRALLNEYRRGRREHLTDRSTTP